MPAALRRSFRFTFQYSFLYALHSLPLDPHSTPCCRRRHVPPQDAGHNYRVDNRPSGSFLDASAASASRKKGGHKSTLFDLLTLFFDRAVDSGRWGWGGVGEWAGGSWMGRGRCGRRWLLSSRCFPVCQSDCTSSRIALGCAVQDDYNGDVLLLRYLLCLLREDLAARLVVFKAHTAAAAAAAAASGSQGGQQQYAAVLQNSLLWRVWTDPVRAAMAATTAAAPASLDGRCSHVPRTLVCLPATGSDG